MVTSPVVKHAKYWDIGKLKAEGGVEILTPPPISPVGVLESAIFGVVGPEGAYLSSKHGVPPVVLQSKISCRPMTTP